VPGSNFGYTYKVIRDCNLNENYRIHSLDNNVSYVAYTQYTHTERFLQVQASHDVHSTTGTLVHLFSGITSVVSTVSLPPQPPKSFFKKIIMITS